MTQYGFFIQNGTVIMVIIVHSWNYETNSREAVAHFMITDDLKKTNIKSTNSLKTSSIFIITESDSKSIATFV